MNKEDWYLTFRNCILAYIKHPLASHLTFIDLSLLVGMLFGKILRKCSCWVSPAAPRYQSPQLHARSEAQLHFPKITVPHRGCSETAQNVKRCWTRTTGSGAKSLSAADAVAQREKQEECPHCFFANGLICCVLYSNTNWTQNQKLVAQQMKLAIHVYPKNNGFFTLAKRMHFYYKMNNYFFLKIENFSSELINCTS